MKRKSDREFMQMAIDQARAQASRFGLIDNPDRPSPLVGCVVVTKEGKVVAGYRGELSNGDHAEFTVLEKKMAHDVLAGATVYTTLEPCVERNPPKKACAQRLIDRRVARVVIGYMDPDERGKGYHELADKRIDIDLFPRALVEEIMELNRGFIESRKTPRPKAQRTLHSMRSDSSFKANLGAIEKIAAYIDRERNGTVHIFRRLG